MQNVGSEEIPGITRPQTENQLEKIAEKNFISLQLDESIDIQDLSQLFVFIK